MIAQKMIGIGGGGIIMWLSLSPVVFIIPCEVRETSISFVSHRKLIKEAK